MTTCWRTLVTLVVLSFPLSAQAEELHIEFLEGLRRMGYYDYALLHLDQLQTKPNVSAETRQLIPFEKAITLLASVRTLSNPEAQNLQLDQALAFLQQFVKENPNHAKAGQANTEQARILLGKARVEVWQSQSPSNKSSKGEFQTRARGFITQGRAIFQKANDQHKTTWEGFPKFLDQIKDKARYEVRKKAEVAYIRAQLDLALSTYEESQTYDNSAVEYKKLLTTAAGEFEAIHTKYRSQVGGLYARMWQGKCFEEQSDIKKALGIYNELLGHPGKSKTMRRLQNQVRQFRLICLNHDDRKDYQLVIQEAVGWLGPNRTMQRSTIGLGIRWELLRAQELLASKRGTAPKDQDRLLNSALTNARFINKYQGQYKDVSTFKMRELMVRLKGDTQDPEDFDTAFGIGRDLIKKIKGKMDAVSDAKAAKAPADELAKVVEDERQHLTETARILRLALDLVEDKTDQKDVNHACYLLAYVHYLTKDSYEAAILGEFVAMHYKKGDDAQVALDSAYLAMAAYVQGYNASDKDQRDVDMRYMVRVCEVITNNWPQSDRANDARMQIGRVYNQTKEFAKAAEWFDKVPQSAEQYSQAQVSAGQANWAAYLAAAVLPDDEKPPRADLDKWIAGAEKHLQAGIEKTQGEIAPTGKAPNELIAAKVSLVQIILSKGDYQSAIKLLTEEPHPVMQAIAIPEGTERPKTGITTPDFASLSYQLLLRAYVGTQQLDEARTAMKNLEAIAEQSGSGEAVTAIYVALGGELEKELKTLKGLGETARLAEVRKSFETFLNDMFSRKDQSYGSLIWISETYYGLGQGSDDDKNQAGVYFDKAAGSYEAILKLAKEKPDEIDGSKLNGVKLRLVNCKRRQGEFEKALEIVSEIIVAKPKALDAQIEAGYVIQDWADSGQADTWKKFRQAMNGGEIGKQKAPFWGWGQIGLRLQRIIAAGGSDARQKYEAKHYEARYNVSYCRHKYGLAQSNNTKKKKEELQKAKYEILAFASISANIDEEWWDKFDNLYQQIQRDLGESVVKLKKPKAVVPPPPPRPPKKDETELAGPPPNPVPPEGSSNLGLIIFAVLLFGGGGAGMFFMVKKPAKRPQVAYAAAAPVMPPQQRTARGKMRPAQSKEARMKQARQTKARQAQSDKAKQAQTGQAKTAQGQPQAKQQKPTSPKPKSSRPKPPPSD